MASRRLLTLSCDHEPPWLRPYVQEIGAAQQARAEWKHRRRGLVKVLAKEAGLRTEDFA